MASSGAGYFIKGFELIRSKGIKRFVFIPLTVNLILFGIAFYFMFVQLDTYISYILASLPEMFSWLSYLLWPFSLLFLLVFFSFIFSSIANWLAAPFNGLLSERVEAMLTGKKAPDGGPMDIVKDIPRTIGREWSKLKYYIPRALVFLILYWLVPVIGQLMWFLFLAWMMAVQYKDYPFDNHKVAFEEMKNGLKERKGLSYSFGITVAIFSMLPLINLIVMPVAICGATALWVDHYRERYSAY